MKAVMILLVALLVISFQPIFLFNQETKTVSVTHYGVWPTNSRLYFEGILEFVSASAVAHSSENSSADFYDVRGWLEKWYRDHPTEPGVFPAWELIQEQAQQNSQKD